MRALWLALLLVAVWVAPSEAQERRRVALVIGNGAYQSMGALPNPTNDARLIASALQRAGFGTIEPDLDLGQQAFRERLMEFAREARDADVAVIYFAGHGVQLDGANWLLPIDATVRAPGDVGFVGVPMQLMLDALGNARLRILILDACRDNPFPTVYGAMPPPAGLGAASIDRYNIVGTVTMYATQPNGRALDGPPGDNSPYARALARYLPEPGLEIHRLPGQVMDMTLSLTNQRQAPYSVPLISGAQDYLVPPTQTRVGPNLPPVDAATELAFFQAAEGLARNGDCAPIRAHLQRFASGVTAELARAVINNCSSRTIAASTAPTSQLPANYLDTLVARDRSPIPRSEYEAAAARLGAEPEALMAVVAVESGALGAYASDGRPIILFEPHIFSRRTNRQFDASNPNVSYRTWDATRYPRSQEGRWAQLREAFALDPEAALASTSWGMFQMIGFQHVSVGYPTASAFVSDMVQSETRQLVAMEAFIRANSLADELQNKDWVGFAARYNGSGQAERYGRLMAEAYTRFKAVPEPTSPAPSVP